MRNVLKIAAAVLILASALYSHAQAERGMWVASSNNAKSITGDVAFSASKVSIDFLAYTIAEIRTLKPAEVASVFDADANTAGGGTLFRVEIPAAQHFLHKNTLCGSEDTQWMATYVSGRELRVAFFSGVEQPVFSFEAMTNSSALCGTFTYAR